MANKRRALSNTLATIIWVMFGRLVLHSKAERTNTNDRCDVQLQAGRDTQQSPLMSGASSVSPLKIH